MTKTIKLFLTLSLVGLFLAFTRMVFALELNYPDLPGLGALKEGHELGWYIKYFFNLAFFIAAGVSIVTICVGGFLYITRSYKTSTIIRAREYIKNGLLGLLIITLSWTFLYAINPDLTSFKITKKEVGPTVQYGTGSPTQRSGVGFVNNPVGPLIRATISSISQPLNYFIPDVVLGLSPAVGGGGLLGSMAPPASLSSDEDSDAIPDAELPRYMISFQKAKDLADKLVETTEQLYDLTKCCGCGLSKFHYGYEAGVGQTQLELRCQCMPGEVKSTKCVEQIKSCWDKFDEDVIGDKDAYSGEDLLDLIQRREDYCRDEAQNPLSVFFLDGSGSDVPGTPDECWACKNFCEQCGCDTICIDKVIQEAGLQIPSVDSDNKPVTGQKAYEQLLKQKKEEMTIIVGHLKSVQNEIAIIETDLAGQSLELQKSAYLLQKVEGSMFTSEFVNFKDETEQGGIGFWQTRFLSRINNSNDMTLANIPLASATPVRILAIQLPGTNKDLIAEQSSNYTKMFNVISNYYLVNDWDNALSGGFSNISTKILGELNTDDTQEASSRLSLFAVMALNSIGEFQKMLEECIQAAFGHLGLEDLLNNVDVQGALEEMAKSALDKSIGSGITFDLSDTSKQATEYISENMADKIKEDANTKCKSECEVACLAWTPEIKQTRECGTDNCKDCCYRECNQMAANFISKNLSELLNRPLKGYLDEEVQKLLNQTVEETFLDENFRKNFLHSNIVDLLKRGMGGIAQKALKDEIPGLMNVLNTRVVSLLGDFIGDNIAFIDRINFQTLKRWKRDIERDGAKKVAEELVKIMQPVFDKIPGSRHAAYALDELKKPDILGAEEILNNYYTGSQKVTSMTEFLKETRRFSEDFYREKYNIPIGPLSPADVEIIETFSLRIYDLYKDEVRDERKRAILITIKDSYTWIKMLDNWSAGLRSVVLDGIIAMPSQMAKAVTEIAAYTATRYAMVLTEDKLLTPYVYPYTDQIQSLVESLQKLLDLQIKDLLPQFLQQALEKSLSDNVNALLKTVCDAGQRAKATGDSSVEAVIPANTYSWLDGGVQLNLDQEAAMSVCNVYGKLNQEVVKFLPAKFKDPLKRGILETLDKQFNFDLEGFLNKTPAGMLEVFLQLEPGSLVKIVKATPKELLCGEIPIYENASKNAWEDKCKDALVDPGKEGTSAFDFLKGGDADYKTVCPLMQTFCKAKIKDKFPFLVGPVDYLIKMAKYECGYVRSECDNSCDTCPAEKKFWCESCDTVINRSVAFSVIYKLLSEINEPGQEIIVLQWLWVGLPHDQALQDVMDSVANKRGFTVEWNLAKIEIRDMENLQGMSSLIGGADTLAQFFITSFWDNTTLREMLITPPLGVVKPFEVDRQAVLKNPPGNPKQTNFFADTPATFLNDICQKIKYEWDNFIDQKKFPNNPITGASTRPDMYNGLSDDEITVYEAAYWTCDKLTMNPASTLGLDKKLLEYFGNHKYMLQILYDKQEIFIKTEEKPPQLQEFLRFVNEETPLVGLSKGGKAIEEEGMAMMNIGCIVWRSEYGDGSNSYAIPSKLKQKTIEQMKNDCLQFCSDTNHNQRDRCLEAVETQGTGRAMQKLAVFLQQNQTLQVILGQHWKKPLIDYACIGFCKDNCNGGATEKEECKQECPTTCNNILNKTFAQMFNLEDEKEWVENFVKNFLVKKPIEIIEKELKDLFGEWPPKEIKDLLNESAADYLIKQKETQWFGKSLIDTLGRWVGADIWLEKGMDMGGKINGNIGDVVDGAQDVVQAGMNKLFLETPKDFMNFVAQGFGVEMLERFTTRLFDDMTGGCEPMGAKAYFTFTPASNKLDEWFVGPLNKEELSEKLSDKLVAEVDDFKKDNAIINNIEEGKWSIKDSNGNLYYVKLKGGELEVTAVPTECKVPRFFTMEKGGQCCHLGKGLVCKDKDKTCKECRFLGDEETKISCYDFEEGEYDSIDNGKFINLRCCRTLKEQNNQCCQTVIDCLIDKINFFLKHTLTNMLNDNGPPLDSIKDFNFVGF